ncbi:uncharacterized protein DUF262 [Stutzerimonas stutzeri]|nr:uncharacterized protein DUF262 [Stutzerimonas stutzeri]
MDLQSARMNIQTNNYSIAELVVMLERKELRVNRDYQRGAELWPAGPRSYFIDTILSGFPFPKIYLFETYDRISRQVKKELVDGQQRIGTIADFVAGKFSVSGDSDFAGKKFEDLDEEQTQAFMAYSVSCDVIRNASRSDILEMFRRMNAYTLPLNEAEKRHSSYYGDFKWFINSLTDGLGDFLSSHVFTNRQIVRMSDAELISDIVLGIHKGVVSTSPSDLNKLYKENDSEFAQADALRPLIIDQFRIISERLPELTKTLMMKPYALYSLVLSLVYLNTGLPPISRQMAGIVPPANVDWQAAQERLISLARAHETKELDGPFGEYVWGCTGGTNRAPRRYARMRQILLAFGFTSIPAYEDVTPDNLQ